jgi:hypothetical protein
MTDGDRALEGVHAARKILGRSIERGTPRDAEATLNDLLSVLDSDDFVAALERIDRRATMRLVQIG